MGHIERAIAQARERERLAGSSSRAGTRSAGTAGHFARLRARRRYWHGPPYRAGSGAAPSESRHRRHWTIGRRRGVQDAAHARATRDGEPAAHDACDLERGTERGQDSRGNQSRVHDGSGDNRRGHSCRLRSAQPFDRQDAGHRPVSARDSAATCEAKRGCRTFAFAPRRAVWPSSRIRKCSKTRPKSSALRRWPSSLPSCEAAAAPES